MANFRCLECNSINSGHFWDEATLEVYGKPGYSIDEYFEDDNWQGSFVCPICYADIDKADNKIEKVA